MIDWIKSAELNKCTVEWLKSRFERFPSSNKQIIRICDNCGEERILEFQFYNDLCHMCAVSTKEFREKISKHQVEFYKDQKRRDDFSTRMIKHWSNQDNRDIQSELKFRFYDENPDMRGGNDIINHHYIYDDNDKSLYTMKMSRSLHSALYNVMRKFGIEVPHINEEV